MDRILLDGRYEIRGVLGRGGMAVVHDGWDRRLHRSVAIKLLRSETETPTVARDRFIAEARAAAALNHPNIVAVHDFGEHDGTPYIVMERLSGTTVGDLMVGGPLPPHRVAAILEDVLAALHAAHSAGVLHRDIKPANLLMSGDRVKVADLGIAKTAGTAHTATGEVVGTICYLSPGRVLGRAATPADDLYAAAVVAYEALTGRRAYDHDNPAAVAHAILHAPPPLLADIRPDVAPTLRETIDRAMRPGGTVPFPSAAAMSAALAGHTDNTGPEAGTSRLTAPMPTLIPPPRNASETAPLPGGPNRSRRRTSMAVLGGAAALLTALLVAVVVIATGSDEDTPVPANPTSLPAAESLTTESRPTPPPSTVDVPAPIPVPTGATETDTPQPEEGPAGSGGNGRGNSGGGNGGGGKSENKGNGKPKDDKN
ncbi:MULTISPECIES: serine/threonine-protein kinase [unclassified Gordonia (in: high G+C Gram-positive bacteria)]|uniref:serine/threonine-protein kinase n=1 Tax=unclassified Gordonia (in: high G+C Gram-positive bacteria) TaxID=2657482 RepID=UPI0010F730A3|nr:MULTISPECIES: serine/threonine-protein kinase [unclassified Gordonia (in: high G+C Gram-positive bacteria)]